MKRAHKIMLVGMVCLMFSLPAHAQTPGGARYLVQAGDSLSTIAARFGLSVENLVQANALSNPDQLDAGMELVLPGIDWVEGLILAGEMPFGENLTSLSRKFRTDATTFSRLNRISSPLQLYAGRPILLATGHGEQPEAARAALQAGQTMMELGILTGSNPWAIAMENRLRSPTLSLPGDVLLLPQTEQPGAGGMPSPVGEVTFGAGGLVQGKATPVKMEGVGGALTTSVILMGVEFPLFPFGEDAMAAMVGVPAMAEPGHYEVVMKVTLPDGSGYQFEQLARVRSGGYGFETVTVAPELLDADLSARETAQIADIVKAFTPEKFWNGFFSSPSPFDNNINSAFGTRRSFNGSGFEYFHAGVDFGGGQGVQIFAPARGKVVFAGSLEIRGNATIIDHGWGVYSGYFHQLEILVQVGEMVEAGQVIGIVGNTGRSSGAHLHWEIWVGGIQVDALEWLTRQYP